MKEIRRRLIEYKKANGLSNEAVFLQLKEAGVTLSGVTVNNWLGARTLPASVYEEPLKRFLKIKGA